MKILVLNCGSSSVKFKLINMQSEQDLAKGVVEKIGSSDAIITYQPSDKNKLREIREVLNHGVAIEMVISLLLHPQHGVIKDKTEIDGIGHRVVHGGEEFSGSVFVNDDVKSAIHRCMQFAPLHNPHNLKGIEGCETLLPGVPQVAVFDTAFHHTIPPKAYLYGLPYALYEKLGIRRYGFHGTSHQYVAQKAAETLGRPIEELKIITCHLGNGASIAAVDGGCSVDTSMGFTPLEGLIMGTRCGNIDPALVPYIMKKENLTADQIDNIMNKNSGMLGLTGTSNDMREIEAEADRGSKQHQLALIIYGYRLRKFIGSYMAALGGVDAIVFTGGIGENNARIRSYAVENMACYGLEIDEEKNQAKALDISKGKVKLLVIPTDEELAIARDTKDILENYQDEKAVPEPETPVMDTVLMFSDDDRADLVLLWTKKPNADVRDLTDLLNLKTGKDFESKAVGQELARMGLQRVSLQKKKELEEEK